MSFQPGKIGAESPLNFRRGPQAAAVAPSTEASLLPVLVVLHQETSTPGRVGNVLRALGHKLDIRRPRFGDPGAAAVSRNLPRRPDARHAARRPGRAASARP